MINYLFVLTKSLSLFVSRSRSLSSKARSPKLLDQVGSSLPIITFKFLWTYFYDSCRFHQESLNYFLNKTLFPKNPSLDLGDLHKKNSFYWSTIMSMIFPHRQQRAWSHTPTDFWPNDMLIKVPRFPVTRSHSCLFRLLT